MRLPGVPLERPADPLVTSLYHSRGWHEHIVLGKGRDQLPTSFGTENNRRNIALSIFVDGFQPHKRVQKSLTVIQCMILNLPENLRHKSNLMPLIGLIPGPKAPKTTQPYLQFVIDELLHLYNVGFVIEDPTIGNAKVTVPVKALFTCADLPAHCDMYMQQGQQAIHGCIKSHVQVRLQQKQPRETCAAIPTIVRIATHQSHLHFCALVCVCACVPVQGNSQHRRVCYGGYTDALAGQLPTLRTHASVAQDAARAQEFIADGRPVDTSVTRGVQGASVWLQLPYFDIVRHSLLDMMHLCSGVVGRHLVPLVQGKRLRDTMQAGERASATAAATAAKKNAAKETREQAQAANYIRAENNKRRKQANQSRAAAASATPPPSRARGRPRQADEEKKQEYKDDEEHKEEPVENLSALQKQWQMSEKMMLRIEESCYQHIRAPQGVAPLTKRPLTQTSEMQAHQWINFVKVYGKYLLSQHFQGAIMTFIAHLLDFIKLTLSSTVDNQTMHEIGRLRDELFAKVQIVFPSTEWSMVLHLLLFHIPDTILLWGPTRGYWCFPFERSVRTKTIGSVLHMGRVLHL